MENNVNEKVQEKNTEEKKDISEGIEEKKAIENAEDLPSTELLIVDDIQKLEPDKELNKDPDAAGDTCKCDVSDTDTSDSANKESKDIDNQLENCVKGKDGEVAEQNTASSDGLVVELDRLDDNCIRDEQTLQEESEDHNDHNEHVSRILTDDNANQESNESVNCAEKEQNNCDGNVPNGNKCVTPDLSSISEQDTEAVLNGVIHIGDKDMGANSSSGTDDAKDKYICENDSTKKTDDETCPTQNESHNSTNVDESARTDNIIEVETDTKLENIQEIDTNTNHVPDVAQEIETEPCEGSVSESSSNLDADQTNLMNNQVMDAVVNSDVEAGLVEEIARAEQHASESSNNVDTDKTDATVNAQSLQSTNNDDAETTNLESTSGVNDLTNQCSCTDTIASEDTSVDLKLNDLSNDNNVINVATNTDTVIILGSNSEVEKPDTVDKESYTDEFAKLEMEKEEKSVKLEAEAEMLREELSAVRAALKASQCHAQQQQARYNEKMMSLKLELYRSQTALKQQRAKSDSQLSDVISHLSLLEGQLKKEQWRVKGEIRHKNEVIENQKKEIVKLKDQNEQLLNAIKEICASGGMNGYMRENKQRTVHFANGVEHSGKNGKEKKSHNGKLGSVRDKFSWKNRSSLELGSLNLEKYLIQQERLCSSQEDLQTIGTGSDSHADMIGGGPGDRFRSASVSGRRMPSRSQNFFDPETNNKGVSQSLSESSQLSDLSNTSGLYSMSDPDDSMTNGNPDDEEEDDRHFSFSSTHINMVIDEEDVIGPITHSGQMMSMGSMPTLANIPDDPGQRWYSAKNRPHSLSSVDLASIQQQAQNLAQSPVKSATLGGSTPPSSPSYIQNKTELTPFQTFKTMFKRKGSKNKGNKKRSVSLSQTTNKEYSEALKKHFQKYDMS